MKLERRWAHGLNRRLSSIEAAVHEALQTTAFGSEKVNVTKCQPTQCRTAGMRSGTTTSSGGGGRVQVRFTQRPKSAQQVCALLSCCCRARLLFPAFLVMSLTPTPSYGRMMLASGLL
jgi:hypothetical protein